MNESFSLKGAQTSCYGLILGVIMHLCTLLLDKVIQVLLMLLRVIMDEIRMEGMCQGMSKTGSILDIRVPAELQQVYEGSLKGNVSLLNA